MRVILNLFQHLITIEDELRGFIPLWRGDRGVCCIKSQEQIQLLRTHPSPTKVELPLQGGDFVNARRKSVLLNLFQHLNKPSPTGEIPKQVRDDSHCRTNFKAQISKLSAVMLNWFQHLITIEDELRGFIPLWRGDRGVCCIKSQEQIQLLRTHPSPTKVELPLQGGDFVNARRKSVLLNEGRKDSCLDTNVKAQISKLSAVMLNWFQHLITIEDELRGFLPLSRGDQGVCCFQSQEQIQLLRTHPSPTKVELPLQGGDFMNARREPVMLNLIQHLNQPIHIPNQVQHDSRFGTNVKAQMSKLSAVMLNLFQHLFQPSPIEIPNQVRGDSRFDANVKAQMSKLTLSSGRR